MHRDAQQAHHLCGTSKCCRNRQAHFTVIQFVVDVSEDLRHLGITGGVAGSLCGGWRVPATRRCRTIPSGVRLTSLSGRFAGLPARAAGAMLHECHAGGLQPRPLASRPRPLGDNMRLAYPRAQTSSRSCSSERSDASVAAPLLRVEMRQAGGMTTKRETTELHR